MVTRSIVGRFLILAVLLASLGVIAQAAIKISQGPGKALAKAEPAARATPVALAAAAATPAPPATVPAAPAPASAQRTDVQSAAQPADAVADAAPVRVVYPGPLGDAPVQPRKIAAMASATPAVPAAQPAAFAAPAAAAPVVPVAAPAAMPVAPVPANPAKPSPVVVASADADTQPVADPAGAGNGAGSGAGKGSIDLNSASIDALNHLGGGHIGQAIVKHRPYSSVEDLVKKRIVRRSVYEQIKNQVAAQ